MSRQGNYVSVPGGNTNWTEGIASTLAMLSKNYGDRASDEREAKRLEAAQEESARRFEWEKKLRESQERRAQEEADRKAKELARIEHNRDVEGSLDVGFGSEDLGPNVQERIATARKQLETKRNEVESNIAAINERRNFLTPEGGFSAAGQAEYDARLGSYMEMYNDPAKAAELAKADVLTMRDNAVANDYETVARAELDRVQTAFDNQLSRLPMSGTIEEYIAAGVEAAKAAGHKDPNSKELRDFLRGQAVDKGLKTRGDIIASGQAAAETAYNRRKDAIGFLKDFYTTRAAASKASGKSTGMSSAEFTTAIDKLDVFGDDEKKEAVALFTKLADDDITKGIPPDILREAIILTSSNNVLMEDSTLDPSKPEDLAKVVEVAKALNKGSYAYNDYVKRADFEIGDIPSYSADQLMGRRFNLTIPDKFPTPRSVLARPDVVAFKAKQEDIAMSRPIPEPGTIQTQLPTQEQAADVGSSFTLKGYTWEEYKKGNNLGRLRAGLPMGLSKREFLERAASEASAAKAKTQKPPVDNELRAAINQQRADILAARKDGNLTSEEQLALRNKYGVNWGFDRQGRNVLNYKYPWEK